MIVPARKMAADLAKGENSISDRRRSGRAVDNWLVDILLDGWMMRGNGEFREYRLVKWWAKIL